MCFDTFPGAVAELGWRFQHAESAIGIHAQSIGDGGSHHVFDSAEETAEDFYAPTASSRLHLSKRRDMHRDAVARMNKIDRTLSSIEPTHILILRTAFGLGARGSKGLIETFTAHDNGRGVRVCLLARALQLPTTRAEFERDKKNRQPNDSVIDWMERIRRTKEGVLQQLCSVATLSIQSSVEKYDAARIVRLEGERHVREEREHEQAALGAKVRAEREARERAKYQRRLGHVHAAQHEALRARVAAMS